MTDTATVETAAEGDAHESEEAAERPVGEKASRLRRVLSSNRFRRWGATSVIIALAAVAAVALWQAHSARTQLDALRAQNGDAAHAQQVASDYAVAAARIDYRNFDPWFAGLRTGVGPKLSQQFAASEPALRDLLGQLQWTSSGALVGSDITAHSGDTYQVQVFVDVTTSNVQSPQGVKTTALYPITVDKKNWTITDISGGVAPLAGK